MSSGEGRKGVSCSFSLTKFSLSLCVDIAVAPVKKQNQKPKKTSSSLLDADAGAQVVVWQLFQVAKVRLGYARPGQTRPALWLNRIKRCGQLRFTLTSPIWWTARRAVESSPVTEANTRVRHADEFIIRVCWCSCPALSTQHKQRQQHEQHEHEFLTLCVWVAKTILLQFNLM